MCFCVDTYFMVFWSNVAFYDIFELGIIVC